MQVQAPSSTSRKGSPAAALALVGLVLGSLGIGYLLGSRRAQAEAPARSVQLPRPAPLAASSIGQDLPQLRITMDPADFQELQGLRDEALALGHIAKPLKRYFPARIGEREHAAKLRLKGDLLDHVESERWSMRVVLKDESFEGMKLFSIQAPATRGYLWEWLGHRAARREGLLAPRSMFVSTQLQGTQRGIYFLEEHFTKDLLESQKRREGPIVKFDEEVFWAQSQLRQQGAPQVFHPGRAGFVARSSAFDEERLNKDPGLARQLSDGLARMDSLLQASVAAWEADFPAGADQLQRGAQARAELWQARAAWVEDLVDLRQAAKLHALLSLLHSQHGLAYHNLRFYFDPVAAKLEPIFFDAMAMKDLGPSTPIAQAQALADQHLILRAYRGSPLYRESFALELARMLAPGYLEELLAELWPELELLEAELLASGELPPRFRLARMRSQLMGSRAALRKSLFPEAPLGAVARHRLGADGEGQLEVDLWATSESPVVAEAFLFENGLELAALEVAEDPQPSLGGGALLIGTGKRARFAFDANSRLAGLVKLRAQLQEASDGSEAQRSRGLRLKLRWRYAGESRTQELSLDSRLENDAWWQAASRPRSPSLARALEAHEFLRWDPTRAELWVLAGSWAVQGDLVLPEGLELHAAPGTELRFAPQAVLLSHDALRFKGSREQPIRLGPQDPAAGWSGIIVLDAPRATLWEHVWVHSAREVKRAGWITTGGVSFYRSELNMQAGGILEALGEDALNLFGTTASLQDVLFDGSASDALDADFVQLSVERCRFSNIAADAIDTSGSRARLVDCRFEGIGDKCISAGERSQVEVQGGEVLDAAIGLAAKDLSDVKIQGLRLEGVRNFQLTAYRKKAVFGPATIQAAGLISVGENGPCLAQTGSRITLDGQDVPQRDFDPKELYSDGLLGN